MPTLLPAAGADAPARCEAGGPRISDLLHVPIFPLSNVVFFPHTILPLHVFESRYRRLVLDVLGGDRRFAVFLSRPSEESEAGGSVPRDVGCLGEIVRADALPDGRYNILVMGLVRIRIEEFLTEVPYQVVGASLLSDAGGAVGSDVQEDFQKLARRYFRTVLGRSPKEALPSGPLAALVNTAAANLDADVEERQRLLEIGALAERLMAVDELMREGIDARLALRLARERRPSDPRLN